MHEAKGRMSNDWMERYAGFVTLGPIIVSKTLTFDRLLTWKAGTWQRERGFTVPGERGAYSCTLQVAL